MSLNYELGAIHEWQKASENPLKPEDMHPVLHYLIFGMMAIGIGTITDKNIRKVYERYCIYQLMCGPAIRFGDGTELYVTWDDIERYKGLATNVTTETDAQFLKKVLVWANDSWYKVTKERNPDGLSAMEYIAKRVANPPDETEEVTLRVDKSIAQMLEKVPHDILVKAFEKFAKEHGYAG